MNELRFRSKLTRWAWWVPSSEHSTAAGARSSLLGALAESGDEARDERQSLGAREPWAEWAGGECDDDFNFDSECSWFLAIFFCALSWPVRLHLSSAKVMVPNKRKNNKVARPKASSALELELPTESDAAAADEGAAGLRTLGSA